ncbi:MAG: MraY family glycosyltransferase [Verrucomicrobiota bacterium]
MESYEAILIFLCGLAVTVVATPMLIKLGKAGVGMDTPDQFRKGHGRSISRLGGLPIFLSLLAVSACATIIQPALFTNSKWAAVILCNLLIFALGFVDDIRSLGAKIKLVGQILVAILAYFLGLRIEAISSPIGDHIFDLGGISLFVTLLWLVALPNIINLIDGMDGLASGVGMFLCLTLGIVGVVSGQHEVAVVALGMAGALLGFLFFNFPPARIFLGDGGAYLIGFFIGSVSLASSHKGSVAAALFVILIALGLPILDTTFAIIRRAARGLPLFRADADHIHHRLMVLGFSKNTALMTMYAACVVLSLIGMSIFWSKGETLPIAGAVFFLMALAAARYLGYVKSWVQLREQFRRALARRKDIQYAHLLGQLLEVELDRSSDSEAYWKDFDAMLERVGFVGTSRVDHSLQPPEHLTKLSISLPSGDDWILYHPKDSRDEGYWARVADCFLPAYAEALSKWGHAPSSIGGSTVDRGDKRSINDTSSIRAEAVEAK